MIYLFLARSSLIKHSMFIFYPYKALYVNSAFSIYKLNFRKKMPKKFTPKKASAPTKTPAPKKAAPKKAAPKKPPLKKASAPNKEITLDIKALASHLPPVPKKTFTAKKNVKADIEDFDLEEYKASAQDTSRHSRSFSVHSPLF